MRAPSFARIWPALFAAVVALGLAGCQVQLVGAYDAEADKSLNEIHGRVQLFINRMETEAAKPAPGNAAAAFAANADFYDRTGADLTVLATRLAAAPLNERLGIAMEAVRGTFTSMRDRHRAEDLRHFNATTAKVWRDTFAQQFGIAIQILAARKP